MIEIVNLSEKVNKVTQYWHPGIVGEMNEMFIKLAKLKGEFLWHHHETEDELFLVVKGTLIIKLREKSLKIEEGEFVVIPHGVEHMPVAEQEVHVLLMEPKTTRNTGNVEDDRTVESEWI
jgi:mannose-6-phosphate isomerase-like protein (cupin superfamily)